MNQEIKVPFSPPEITNEEIEEVVCALKSGWITTGPRVKKFEKMICDYVCASKCVCLNSQTAGAELALRLLEVKEGDEVITSAYTYTATASVIAHVGAKIVLVDTQKDSPLLDYDALDKAITEKTKVIIPVDIAGVPCDYDRIFKIVESKKALFKPNGKIQSKLGRIAVLADTAHALGATYKGKMVGSIADFSSFSFHAVKNLTTAEGGALAWRTIDGIDDEDIYKTLQVLSLHGQTKDAFSKTILGSWEYDVVGTYYKCNMTDIHASLGIKQLERYEKTLNRRKEIIAKYDNAFKDINIKTLKHIGEDYCSSGHLYITRVVGATDEIRREIIIKMAEKGVVLNVHYKPLPMLTAYKNLGFDIKNYPNAYEFYKNEITLPLNTCLTDEQVDYVIKCYLETIKECVK